MVSPILPVLLLASVLSSAISQKDTTESIIQIGDDKEIRLDKYLTESELISMMDDLAKDYGHIFKHSEIGRSSKFKSKIWAVQISHNVQEARVMLKPMVKLVGNIHGNDAVGYNLLTSLMQYLVYSDEKDPRVTQLLNTTDIWIVPTMNPDGLTEAQEGCDKPDNVTRLGKLNGNGVDLDKNFPGNPEDILNPSAEPETKHMLKLMMDHPFVLSANLQGGTTVASYFLDTREFKDIWKNKRFDKLEKDDSEVFKRLATQYANSYPLIYMCENSFVDDYGITHDTGNWRSKDMQWANYILTNCLEMVFYVSCCHYPPASDLPLHWYANLHPFLSFMESARTGVYGLIKDEEGNPVKEAVIVVTRYRKETKGTDRGEYWRLLNPGSYAVSVSAPAAVGTYLYVNVTKDQPYVQLDFTLKRIGMHGQVTDLYTGKPIQGAKITVEGRNYDINPTTKQGEFWLTMPHRRSYVSASAEGYIPSMKKSVQVDGEDNAYVEVNFALRKTNPLNMAAQAAEGVTNFMAQMSLPNISLPQMSLPKMFSFPRN